MTVGLINNSQSVVYGVMVDVACAAPPDFYEDAKRVKPEEFGDAKAEDTAELVRGYVDALAPGTWEVELRMPVAVMESASLDIHFRDHKGTYWQRDFLGGLDEQTRPFARLPWSGLSRRWWELRVHDVAVADDREMEPQRVQPTQLKAPEGR